MRAAVFCVLLSLVYGRIFAYVEYNTPRERLPGKLNVHIVCHSHIDPGWLKTYDQYQYGTAQDIQIAGVNFIAGTTMQQLQENPNRTFSYGEMAFFSRWWDGQSPRKQKNVKELVTSWQLEFVNGGWVQNDEASAHYVAMVDQTTRGHKFLNETFGILPRVGWQIDVAGHSATQAVLAAETGFDGLFFARIHHKDYDKRIEGKSFEFVWEPATSNAQDTRIFAGTFARGPTYVEPTGLSLEWGINRAEGQCVDDEASPEYNVEKWVDLLIKYAENYAEKGEGNDVLILMGNDFRYANAISWYTNLDKIIHYTNKRNSRVHVFYSTMTDYVDAKNSQNTKWSVKKDDFFPYADIARSYWTGYFSSRPASKGYIRMATAFLQAARQLEVVAGVNSSGPNTESLEAAVSLLQHHNAITGTERQAVANDYHRILSKGLWEARQLVFQVLADLVDGKAASGMLGNRSLEEDKTSDQLSVNERPGPTSAGAFVDCPLLNASVCPATVQTSDKRENISIVAYNSLAWSRTDPIRVPIKYHKRVEWNVYGPDGREVPSQVNAIGNATSALQSILVESDIVPEKDAGDSMADVEVVFMAKLPPLGFNTYTLVPKILPKENAKQENVVDHASIRSHRQDFIGLGNKIVALDNDIVRVNFDKKSGRLLGIENRRQGFGMHIQHEMFYYGSAYGGGNPSGAYIFRPNGSFPIGGGKLQTRMVVGRVVQEFVQEYSDWCSLVWRLWEGAEHVEMEWTVGPIPLNDNGKEVVSRFNTTLDTGSVFYTDSNGRGMMRRVRESKRKRGSVLPEDVAPNYYPMTEAACLRQESVHGQIGVEFGIVTDRAQGVSSLGSGSLEVMLHRRIANDDWRGLAEALNETMCGCRYCACPGLVARGRQYITIAAGMKGARLRRRLQHRLSNPLVEGYRSTQLGVGGVRPAWSALFQLKALPPNVHLLTLKDEGHGRLLLRLAHMFQAGEDPELARAVDVDLRSLLGENCKTITEMQLTGIKPLSKVSRLEWNLGDSQPSAESPETGANEVEGRKPKDDLRVSISPMQIRTFHIKCVDLHSS